MAVIEVSLYCGTNTFQENISFLDFSDLQGAKNSGKENKKYDIIFMLCTVSRFPLIYIHSFIHTYINTHIHTYENTKSSKVKMQSV